MTIVKRMGLKVIIATLLILAIQHVTAGVAYSVGFWDSFKFALLYIILGTILKWIGLAGLAGGAIFVHWWLVLLMPIWYSLGSMFMFRIFATGSALASLDFWTILVMCFILHVFVQFARVV